MSFYKFPKLFYLLCLPVIAIIGALYCLITEGFIWQTWLLFLVMYVMVSLGITAGYHRLFAHRSYECPSWMRVILLILAAGAIQMSVYPWCYDHRNHHRYSDKAKDPHNSKKGFWYAHVLWILEEPRSSFDNINDLKRAKFCQWQVKYYWLIAFAIAVVLPCLLSSM